MPVETIIFDLGQTLIPFSFDRLRPLLEPCRESAARLIAQAEIGELGPRDFQTGMCRLTGIPFADFPAWWNSIFAPSYLVPEVWVRGLARYYRLGLISNTNALHFSFLERQYSLLRAFSFRILSHQVGAAKPAPAIYAAAEAAAGCAPEAIFYLDDIPAFVEAARRRSWRAEVFGGWENLSGLLAAHGLQCAPLEVRPAAVAAPSRAKSSPSSPGS